MKPENSLPYPQEPASGLYNEQDESSPYNPSYFSKIHFQIILPPTSKSSH
jgi:hypothetical protein